MKHLGAILCALIAAGVAIYLLIITHAQTTVQLLTIVGLLLLAFALAIPAQFREAAGAIAPYIPLFKKPGGDA